MLLGARGAYAGGQGHAGTSQIGHLLLIKGTLVQKPRFWVFRAKALAALAKAWTGESKILPVGYRRLPQRLEIAVRIGRPCPFRSCLFPISWSQRGHSEASISGSE
jgi:hypothetical protein